MTVAISHYFALLIFDSRFSKILLYPLFGNFLIRFSFIDFCLIITTIPMLIMDFTIIITTPMPILSLIMILLIISSLYLDNMTCLFDNSLVVFSHILMMLMLMLMIMMTVLKCRLWPRWIFYHIIVVFWIHWFYDDSRIWWLIRMSLLCFIWSLISFVWSYHRTSADIHKYINIIIIGVLNLYTIFGFLIFKNCTIGGAIRLRYRFRWLNNHASIIELLFKPGDSKSGSRRIDDLVLR